MLGIQTFGYKHDVVFPLDLKVADKGKPLDLRLGLDILVCAEQCVPEHFDLALGIPAGAATPDGDAQILAKARAAVPGDARTAGMSIASAQEVSDKGKPALEIKARSDQPFARARHHPRGPARRQPRHAARDLLGRPPRGDLRPAAQRIRCRSAPSSPAAT